MNNDVFKDIVKKILDACESSLLGSKHSEYTRREDRFHNFKSAAKKRNKHHIDILLDYQVKHRVSIDDICDDTMLEGIYPTDEFLLEKIKDDINYNIMLFGMIVELRDKARMKAMEEENRTMGVGEQVQTITADELKRYGKELEEITVYEDAIPVECHFTKTRDQKEALIPIPEGVEVKINDPQATVESGRKIILEIQEEAPVKPNFMTMPDVLEAIQNAKKSMDQFGKSLASGLNQDKQTGDI